MRQALMKGQIVIHPFVIGELALGSLRHRSKTLAMLDSLPQVLVAQLSELRIAIERHRLHSLGIGLIDAHLLASVFLSPPTLLWTRDRRLRKSAEAFGVDVSLP